MSTIYQLTFFLALALLAILITIFVFAVSLLGRAMEAAAKTEKAQLLERKQSNEEAMAAIKKEIEEAEGQIPKGLTQKLAKLEKRDKDFGRELAKIRKSPEVLTVRGGVVPPSALLIGALILSGTAWGLSNIQNLVSIALWLMGSAAIGYSTYRIYKSLKVIESVAITSEEAALKRTIEAFKIAQKELEEEKRPELELLFLGKQPPFRVKADSEMSLLLALSLGKGEFAEDVAVHICAPPGFDFPNQATYTLTPDHVYANYIARVWHLQKVFRALDYRVTITIKSPPIAGTFKMVYYIFCRGSWTYEGTELEIIVEGKPT